MREEIEKAALNYLKTQHKFKIDRLSMIYYLSGYFKNKKVYLTDVLKVIEKLRDENLIDY